MTTDKANERESQLESIRLVHMCMHRKPSFMMSDDNRWVVRLWELPTPMPCVETTAVWWSLNMAHGLARLEISL